MWNDMYLHGSARRIIRPAEGLVYIAVPFPVLIQFHAIHSASHRIIFVVSYYVVFSRVKNPPLPFQIRPR